MESEVNTKQISINQKLLALIIILIILEVFSFLGFFMPIINALIFIFLCLVALILSIKKLQYGLYLILTELFIGSQGYLFSLNILNFKISIRIALFCIVLAVWLFKFLIKWREKIKENKKFFSLPKDYLTFRYSQFFIFYVLFFIFLIWGVIAGVINHNTANNIFFDFNNWLFFCLVVVFYDVIKSFAQVKKILLLMVAGLSVLCLKVLFLAFIFAHQIQSLTLPLYQWLSIFKLAEITPVSFDFYRVFLQSDIYALITFFLCLCLIFLRNTATVGNGLKPFHAPALRIYKWLFFTSGIIMLISFSRSYWVGCFVGLIAFFFIVKIIFKNTWKKLGKIFLWLIFILLLQISTIHLIVNFPKILPIKIPFIFSMQDRLTTGDVSSESRKNMLMPMFRKIVQHPIIGSGFGATATYKSLSPRHITPDNPEGWYTTYAFEWGYLDIILKIGLAGLIVYLVLIGKIILKGLKIFNDKFLISNQIPNSKFSNNSLVVGLLLGLVALLVTHIFSPYLNHPLGISYLMLCGVIFEIKNSPCQE